MGKRLKISIFIIIIVLFNMIGCAAYGNTSEQANLKNENKCIALTQENIEVQIDGSNIKCINNYKPEKEQDIFYAWYLLDNTNQKVIDKQMYQNKNYVEWKLDPEVIYQVKSYIKMGDYKCDLLGPVLRYNKEKQTFTVDPINKKSLKLIFTVDVEDKYENVPNMIECKFGKENCGIDYIMDVFEKNNMKGVFFVNIYEHLNYSGKYNGYIESLLKRINKRGHEIGLHTHNNEKLDFFNQPLNVYNYEQQDKIMSYGSDFIENSINKRPIVHRGGGFDITDDTFLALNKNGIKYDSTCYYGRENNKNQEYKSINQLVKYGDVTEFPIIVGYNTGGRIYPLDLNHMTYEEIISIIKQMQARDDFPVAQIMFHSFSFVDQKGKEGQKPVYELPNHPMYGVDKEMKEKFEKLLQYINLDPDIEVITFEDYDNMNSEIPSIKSDCVFSANSYTARENANQFNFQNNNVK
ncbi:hypothetical protein FDC27_05705 [Clostridium botulinum]|nr:hypothetical protein [Clostridium botulinum]NFL58856.1 hypothetical protein [Clostridium botulinum]NFL61683.1 hypothetical protein [Clostridium botulinum]NFO66473.1 hypothetical protein [Clostridium botulinum]